MRPLFTVLIAASAAVLGAGGPAAANGSEPPGEARLEREPVVARPHLDRSGKKRVGKASFYARRFAGRKMADGTPMNPKEHVAASKTLPLGTEAKVTNLETGQSTEVTIQDRGPYVKGRIVDLSPAAAEKIGITPKEGVATVEVAPIKVPPPKDDGKDAGKP